MSLGAPVRGTRLAAREIIAEPSGKCGGLRGRSVHDHIALPTCVLAERASGTTVDATAEFLLRCADLGQQATGSSVRYCARNRSFTASMTIGCARARS